MVDDTGQPSTLRSTVRVWLAGGRSPRRWTWDSAAGEPELRSLYDYHAWREQLKSVQEISAFRMLTPTLIAPGIPPESVRVASMSASGFRVARVQPLMGRYLEKEDEREGAPSVVVIGEEVWRKRFEGDPAILGRTIQLGATPHSIIGVMPKDFAFPVNDHLWVPLRAGLAPSEPLKGSPLTVFGRLAGAPSNCSISEVIMTMLLSGE